MVDEEPIRYFLDIKNLGANGYEVVVSVVNEGEEWLYVRGAKVEIIKDNVSFGTHAVTFINADNKGVVRLGQFEIAKGNFHIQQDIEHNIINFRVLLDYKFGDYKNETQKISRRIETKRITKSK